MGYPTDKNGEACSAFHTGEERGPALKERDPFRCSNRHCKGMHISEFMVCSVADKCYARMMGDTSKPQVLDGTRFVATPIEIPEPTELPGIPEPPTFTASIPGLRFVDDNSAPAFLRRALKEMEARAVIRDQPGGERAMARTVAIFNAIRGDTEAAGTLTQGSRGIVSELDGWLFMIALKLARSRGGKFNADDYTDLASYAALAGECAAKQG